MELVFHLNRLEGTVGIPLLPLPLSTSCVLASLTNEHTDYWLLLLY